MSSIAEILEWKFPNTPKIKTRQNSKTGKMEIFDWPGPGPVPSKQQITAWQTQFDARVKPTDPIQDATTLDELKAALAIRLPFNG